MILDEFVEIEWHSRNKNYYVNKGYIFTKVKDKFLIKINDLQQGSHTLIYVKCNICGKKKYIEYWVYNKNIKKGGYYGCSNKCSMKKNIDTNLKKYGVAYSAKLDNVKESVIKTTIERYGEIYEKLIPRYNINSIIYLDMLSEKLNLHIQHALNGGEKKFVRYWVDGYIEKHNICIEWDEKQHNSKRKTEKDVIKEQYLKENFGSRIIRIIEKDFLKDIDNQINVVCEKFNNIIKLAV